MKYIKWQDELSGYLGSLPRDERDKVFSYFAEMYADKRDAGLEEEEIIEEFGAPYDVAKRILSENGDRGEPAPEKSDGGAEYTQYRGQASTEYVPPRGQSTAEFSQPNAQASAQADNTTYQAQANNTQPAQPQRKDRTWVFVLLCVLFALPIFFVVLAMVIVTVTIIAMPFGVMVSGFSELGCAVGALIGGSATAAYATAAIGLGLLLAGAGVALLPLAGLLVKLMWKLFKKLFAWLKSLFVGREAN